MVKYDYIFLISKIYHSIKTVYNAIIQINYENYISVTKIFFIKFNILLQIVTDLSHFQMNSSFSFLVKITKATHDCKSNIEEFDENFLFHTKLIVLDEFKAVREQIAKMLQYSNFKFKFSFNYGPKMGKLQIIFYGVYIYQFIICQQRQIQIQFKKCEIELLDYTESGLSQIMNSNILADNQVNKLYLPRTVNEIQLINRRKNTIQYFFHRQLDQLSVIQICFLEQFLCVENIKCNNIIDLSHCKNLKEIKIMRVQNDILLPDQLEILTITGACNNSEVVKDYHGRQYVTPNQFQHSIQNTVVQAKSISINSFCMKQVKSIQYEQIKLISCKLDTITLLENDSPQSLRRFQDCIFDTLDYSNLNMVTLTNYNYLYNNFINKIILPKKVKQIQLSYLKTLNFIMNIIFTQTKYIEQIVILDKVPKNIYLKGSEKNNFIDLSNFDNLKHIEIQSISSNILLPQKLNTLKITQQISNQLEYSQLCLNCQFSSKILNTKIHSKFIDLFSFDLFNIDLFGFDEIKLNRCRINNLTLFRQQKLDQIINNEIVNLIISSQYKELDLQSNEIINLMFSNIDIEKLRIRFTCFSTVHNNNNIKQLKQNYKIKKTKDMQQIRFDRADPLDFSYCNKLLELDIQLQQEKIILLPSQIQSIKLIYNSVLEPLQIQLFDFSTFTSLFYIEILNFKIKQLVLFEGRLKFQFNDKHQSAFIMRQLLRSSLHSTITFDNFINNINSLDIKGLQLMIFQQHPTDYLDFSVFASLTAIQLENIDNQIVLPKCIQQFTLNNKNIVSQCLQNFNFNDFQQLKEVKIINCQLNNLIVKAGVTKIIDSCKINYLSLHEIKHLIGENNNHLKEGEYFQTNNSIQTLKLTCISIIQRIEVNGLRNIIHNDTINQRDANILDFTHFTSLTDVILINIRCQGIIFSRSQKSIQINQTEDQCKINFLDFSQCQMLQYSYIDNYEINQVYPSYLLKTSLKTSIKILNLCKSDLKKDQLYHYFDQFASTTKYLLYKLNCSQQRYLYRLHTKNCNVQENRPYEAKLSLQLSLILEIKINFLYQKIQLLID